MPKQVSNAMEDMLALVQKSPEEVHVLGKNLGFDVNTAEDLIEEISRPNKAPFIVPQALPLRTRIRGREVEGAIELLKQWRVVIFNGEGNVADFSLLNNEGKHYVMNLKYINCPIRVVNFLVQKKMIFTQSYQTKLLEAIKTKPDQFSYKIIRKGNTTTGSSWLMLYIV